ncbi:MAG: c-type cytochrome [Acidobacteriota bacterium]
MPPIPVPRDIPLPMPVSPLTLEVLIVFLFLLHILFVALMVGGSLLTLVFEVRGRRDRELDTLAREIGRTVTVNKSMAVVLGVGPLLVMNLLYTMYFYSANALTGAAWIMIVPLVTVAFLLTYAHKYSWELLRDRKGLHIAIGAAAAGLFLAVPFIFLTNINLMLFPERWPTVHGFFSALVLPNVLPRYLHFLTASLAITGLFLAGWFGRRGYPAEEIFGRLDRVELRRRFTSLALGATVLQLLFGPLLFFTLPSRGLSWPLAFNIAAGVSLAIAVMWLLWREVTVPQAALGRRYFTAAVLLTGTVIFMGYGRHLYRERAVAPHRAQMASATQTWADEVLAAEMRAATGRQRTTEEATMSPGERVFRSICMGCHAPTTRLVGPPLVEVARIYKGNPAGLAAWVRDPGKKRPDYPQMPPIRLTQDQYTAVADYVLATFGGGQPR